ncbi:MAG TPA: high-potential iron-sulfur protein [Steroidobacteraceae bacterium]|nr:high-potential iron-sulfur protein [Steroidobacteraceae bacterium]
MKQVMSRRRVFVAAASACAAAAALGVRRTSAAEAAPEQVSEKDPLAVALGYVANAGKVDTKANPTFQSGSSCSGCSWYGSKAANAGTCSFFPGKLVSSSGWCRMWAKKS